MNTPVENVLKELYASYEALKQLGFSEPLYAPKNVPVHAISLGSTGIHICTRHEDGSWWTHEGGDQWPYHPIMWRHLP
jgi:hypothetical protein